VEVASADRSREEVVGSGRGVDVAGQVQVELAARPRTHAFVSRVRARLSVSRVVPPVVDTVRSSRGLVGLGRLVEVASADRSREEVVGSGRGVDVAGQVKGVRTFAPIMFKRLEKLGINKTNPDDLTEEEISRSGSTRGSSER
jgi:hypothetical protein